MTGASDAFILEQFAKNESEETFAELVRRYIALVHSVAVRQPALIPKETSRMAAGQQ